MVDRSKLNFEFNAYDIYRAMGGDIRPIFFDCNVRGPYKSVMHWAKSMGLDTGCEISGTVDTKIYNPASVYITRLDGVTDGNNLVVRKYGHTGNDIVVRIGQLCRKVYRPRVILEAVNTFTSLGEALLVEQYFNYLTQDRKSTKYPDWMNCGRDEHMIGLPENLPKSWIDQAEHVNRTKNTGNEYVVNGCKVKFKPFTYIERLPPDPVVSTERIRGLSSAHFPRKVGVVDHQKYWVVDGELVTI